MIENFVVVGKLGKPYGLKGCINVYSVTNPENHILQYGQWYVSQAGQWVPFNVSQIRPNGNHYVAQIENVNTREEAQKYTNKLLAVLRSQLPSLPKNEYYWSDLEGLTVINQLDEVIGTVDRIFETGANDVLVVNGKKRHLIPFVRGKVIKDINLEKKIIKIDWELE